MNGQDYREHLTAQQNLQSATDEIIRLSDGDLYLVEQSPDYYVFSRTRNGYLAFGRSPEQCLAAVQELLSPRSRSSYREYLERLRAYRAAFQTAEAELAEMTGGDLFLHIQKGEDLDDDEYMVFSQTRRGCFAHERSPQACVEAVRKLLSEK